MFSSLNPNTLSLGGALVVSVGWFLWALATGRLQTREQTRDVRNDRDTFRTAYWELHGVLTKYTEQQMGVLAVLKTTDKVLGAIPPAHTEAAHEADPKENSHSKP